MPRGVAQVSNLRYDRRSRGFPTRPRICSAGEREISGLAVMPSVPSPIQHLARRPQTPRFVKAVACGYCQGRGRDAKHGSRCPVCGATGRINVSPPVITCLRCGGSGRENGDLTCLACGGTGVGQIREEAAPCANCGETGEEGIFYCLPCGGQGLV